MSHVGPSGTESTYRLLEIHQSGIQTSRDRGKCNEVEVTTSCDLISNIDVLLNGSLLSGISSAVFISNINRKKIVAWFAEKALLQQSSVSSSCDVSPEETNKTTSNHGQEES